MADWLAILLLSISCAVFVVVLAASWRRYRRSMLWNRYRKHRDKINATDPRGYGDPVSEP